MKKEPKAKPTLKLRVTDLNLRKASERLLGQKLVSAEVQYVQRALGNSATQEQIDEKIRAVRALPWASVFIAD